MRNAAFILMFLPLFSVSQTSKDYSVLLTATAVESPPSITLKWPTSTATSYFVYKKLKSENNFPASFELLTGTDTAFVDTNVVVGESYEYYVRRNANPSAYGYINTGIKVNSELNGLEVKGKLVLLIDSSLSTSLSNEIDELVNVLESECWTVLRHDVSSLETASNVRQLIKDDYNKDAQNTKAVYILGHVAVPYSGDLNPDGHSNHKGAWPTDAYYGDMDGIWTDAIVNNTTSADTRNHNIPGDGKFDHSILPSNLELQVGRVDLSNLPAFSSGEVELMRNYLKKSLDFRTGQIDIERRGIIDDNFGGFSGEAFAASAWKAFSTFFGPDSITFANNGTTDDYRTNLNAKSYLWSYGCGGGSYTSAGGIGNTSQLAGDSLQTIFTALFGSYFGDWDKSNSFLRAPLAQGLTLTNAWSGRPHWYFHHMSLGENIGYSQRISINTNPYFQHYGARFVHVALMGDPTLTMNIIKPPTQLTLSENNNAVDLSWTASADNVLGYHVFRKDSIDGIYHRVNQNIISTTSFTDEEFDQPGQYWYTVRAVKLEDGFSGSFYNLSSGATGWITTEYTNIDEIASLKTMIYPNPTTDVLHVQVSEFQGDMFFELISLDGRTVISKMEQKINSTVNLEFDLSHLSQGIYFLRLSNEKSVNDLSKIIVQP